MMWFFNGKTHPGSLKLTDEKLGFIINYDIKYPMGRVANGEEEGGRANRPNSMVLDPVG